MERNCTLEQIRKWCNGTWLCNDHETTIEELAIDSRKIGEPAVALFIALKTNLRDGHNFIPATYEKGVRNFLVSFSILRDQYPGANFIQVRDTLQALQQIATGYRAQFHIPVIGVTGSNGKTIVKEWLYQLLSHRYNAVRSPMSYNSQIGVPLSVWQMKREHTLAIFEAGISQQGEMTHLERMIQPTIGVFTNVGEAHSEGFLNTRQKINEKLALFRRAKQLIYCRDYHDLNECIPQYVNQVKAPHEPAMQLFTWSQKHEADLHIDSIEKTGGKTTIHATYTGEKQNITIPFTDNASVENAIHCWCVMILLGIKEKEIQRHMLQLQPVSMRMELLHAINDSTLINDSYNSDLTSFQIAVDYLAQQKQHPHHTVVLSDMLQIGMSDSELYDKVADIVARRHIQRFIGVGPTIYKNKALFRKHKKLRSIFFKTTEDFIKNFHLVSFENDAVLLKGARAFAFEKVAALLEQKIHQTVLSINLQALTHNLNVYRSRLSPGVKTMAMVKAFAYGSGSYEIANQLQYNGVDYLAVAYTDEGVALRKAGLTLPVMVMSPDAVSFDRMIAWKLEPEIFNFRSFDTFTEMAHTLHAQQYPIHIKLDTGMHRLGFNMADIDELATRISQDPHIKVASIFSHLAASDDPQQDDFTMQQARLFDEMTSKLVDRLGYKPLLHLCNSAGIIRHPSLHYDMVRPGLGLYGADSSHELSKELTQISSLKTTIAQIRNVPAGDSIGYGHKTFALHDMRVATICIGYADGYMRALGNGKAHVLIHGQPARTIGSICMDMCMVDITHIPDAKEGDKAVVFDNELTVAQLAEWAGTIPYEIMTSISQRVKRVYVNEE